MGLPSMSAFFRRHDVAAMSVLVTISACWVEQSHVGSAKWSDDDEMIAFAVGRYEVRAQDVDEDDSDTEARREGTQIYIVPADLSEEPRALSDKRGAGSDYYLMSEAGYLLVSWFHGESNRDAGPDRLGRERQASLAAL